MHADTQVSQRVGVATGRATVRTATPEGFGDYFRRVTEQSGFANAGQLADATGLNVTTISRWISGKTRPASHHLRTVAPHLNGVRAGDLLIAAGLFTPQELGMVGPPPVLLPTVVQQIMKRLDDSAQHPRRRAHLEAYLLELMDQYDRVIALLDAEAKDRKTGRASDGR